MRLLGKRIKRLKEKKKGINNKIAIMEIIVKMMFTYSKKCKSVKQRVGN